MTIPSKKQKNPIQIITDEGTFEVTTPIAIIDNTIVELDTNEVEQVKSRCAYAFCAEEVK